ncbi:MAG: tyrosine-type recombinase/integrase [Oscillospiraceae bacterium]|nr:tyrosine-type recombinase/integrase [Oscillospiraceae bacterium]
MSDPKLISEVTLELEQKLAERGQSDKVISQYHYIFRVFSAFSKSFGEQYFLRDTLTRCLQEHYGITEQTVLMRRQCYKRKVLRAYKMLCDTAEGRPFVNRYLGPKSMLAIEEHNQAVLSFCEYLSEAGRSPKTIDSYQRSAMRFMDHLEKQGLTQLADLSVELLYGYTTTLTGQNRHTVKSALGPVRVFLRYLFRNEYIGKDLSQFIGKVSVRTQTKIPSIWTKEEVLKLLAAIDRGNPSGKRDYAIILLVARLGIRVGDVNNLKFENIEWRKNSISFVQKKTGNRVYLPLLKDVGWAIIDYVKSGRPQIDSPYIFLTHIPPFKNYADENHLHATIQKYLSLTDIQDQSRKKRGMHSLRHTLANRLQENRESFHTISSALGHTSPDSAVVYVKTDIELLRECALDPTEVGL